MHKRILCFCLVLSMIYLFAYCPVYATDLDDACVSLEEDRITKIDELFELRAKLVLDMEANHEEISAIDQQLAGLGVEEIPYNELAEKLGVSANPRVAVYPDETITWTSYRSINVYRGQFYEFQVITGVPANRDNINHQNCNLLGFDAVVVENSYGGTAAALNIIQFVVSTGVNYAPGFGPVFSTGVSVIDTTYAVLNNLSPTTYVSGANANYSITSVVTQRYVFIKMQGAAETEQICGYKGNYVECKVTATIPLFWDKDGDGTIDPDDITISYEDKVQSYGYNESNNIAASHFYEYRSNGHQYFNEDYHLSWYSLHLLKNKDGSGGETVRIEVPFSDMTFLIPN